MTWVDGRRLSEIYFDDFGDMLFFDYDSSGMRRCKYGPRVNDYCYSNLNRSIDYIDYYYDGDTLIYELRRSDNGEEEVVGYTIEYLYGVNGITGFKIDDGTTQTSYYYVKNIMGDVLGIVNASGTLVAEYRYDAYGNPVMILDGNGNDVSANYAHIANINPIRYRGYYYDIESGFYYLNSRYYDPEIGRFINSDGYVSTGQGLNGYNMFAYCGNNPVMRKDPSGQGWITLTLCILGGIVICASLAGCSDQSSEPASAPAPSKPAPIPSQPTQESLTTDQKVLIATIAAEAAVTIQGNPVSSAGRQAMANVVINRVGKREWSKYTTVAEICQFTGFDGYGDENYTACMKYLNSRDGSNATYEAIIWDVMAAYDNDITGGAQLYYTPATMKPAGSSPDWNFSVLTEVTIPGVDPYYEGRFYKYK